MSGISLITHGWICYGGIRYIINRFVLPLNLSIKNRNFLNALITDKLPLKLNLNNLTDKNINLRLSDNQINIKSINDISINITE